MSEPPEFIRGKPGLHIDPRLANSPRWDAIRRVFSRWQPRLEKQIAGALESGDFVTIVNCPNSATQDLLNRIKDAGLDDAVGYQAET